MGRIAKAEQAARVKARQRRVRALEQDRRARDRRIEDAAAEVFLALQARIRAAQLTCDAEAQAAAGLRRLFAEHLDVAQAAELCELTPEEVRTLTRNRRKRRSAAPQPPVDPAAAGRQPEPADVTAAGSSSSSCRTQPVGHAAHPHGRRTATFQPELFDVTPAHARL